ncbi:MAG: sugar ABC transporter substrate-binding protein [Anaerolineae bacterium]
MRAYLWLIYVIVCGGLLSACGTTSSVNIPSTDTPTPPTLETDPTESNQFVVWGQSDLTLSIDNYIKSLFEAQHPEIDVIFVDAGWDEALRQNFENAIQMGRPPEIVIGENYFRTFAADGKLQAVDSVLAQYDDLIPPTYAGAIYEEQVYAVPYLTGIFAFERNCDVIESAGLNCDDVPQYWDELLADAQAITEAGAGDYYGYTLQGPGGTAVGSAFRIAVYQAQVGGLPCADDACTVPNFNRAESIPVYQFLRDLVQNNPPGLLENTHEGEVYEALFRGVSAYQIAGSWHPEWAQISGCDNCRYSSIPYPRDGQSATLLVGNVLYAAPTNSQHPELALEWLELLLSDEVQSRIFAETGRFPVRTSALTDLLAEADDVTGIFVDRLLNSENVYILPQWGQNPRATWEIYNDLLYTLLTTDQPIDDLMAQAQTQVETLYAE